MRTHFMIGKIALLSAAAIPCLHAQAIGLALKDSLTSNKEARTANVRALELSLQRTAYVRVLPPDKQKTVQPETRSLLSTMAAISIVPHASTTAIANDAATVIVDEPPEPQARKDLAKVLIDEGRRLRAHFSLAQAFESTARDMALVTPDQAAKVTAGVNKLDAITSGLSGAFAIVGGVSFLQGNKLNAGGWSALSGLANLIQPVIGKLRGNDLAASSNASVASALAAARKEAEALAIHSFLVGQLNEKGAGLSAVADLAKKVSETADPDHITPQQAMDGASQYSTLISQIDQFYNSDLAGMAHSLDDYATRSIFTDDSKKKMSGLAGDLRQAIQAWTDARQLYARSQDVAEAYMKTYGKM